MSGASRRRGQVRVAIVGAGFSGIAAAVALKRAGFSTFTVFESSDGPGGVWWQNRYPGAAVDTPTHLYSFSFQRYDWSRSHADRDELQQYFDYTIDQQGIRPHFRFGTPVLGIHWDDAIAAWHVETPTGTELFEVVVSAVGLFSVPQIPEWPGIDSFRGAVFHTAQWDATYDFRGKRVAVVGTGSSSAQVTPKLAEVADQVYVFQRDPGWINPKPITVYPPEERAALQSRWRYKLERLRGYKNASKDRAGGEIHRVGSEANTRAMDACKAYIAKVFADRPDLARAVTPSHAYHGKRPVKDSTFYPSLLRDNVELVPHSVVRVSATGVCDDTGAEREVDAIVLATGFQATKYLLRLPVTGPGDVTLRDTWGDEPSAFLGLMVPGFPNFFIMYGPNTNSPLLVLNFEIQAHYVVRALKRMLRRRRSTIEVRQDVFDRYDRWLQSKTAHSVWKTTSSYFRTEAGRVVTNWPVSPLTYWLLSRVPLSLTTRVGRPARARATAGSAAP